MKPPGQQTLPAGGQKGAVQSPDSRNSRLLLQGGPKPGFPSGTNPFPLPPRRSHFPPLRGRLEKTMKELFANLTVKKVAFLVLLAVIFVAMFIATTRIYSFTLKAIGISG